MTTKRYLLAQSALCTSLVIAVGAGGARAADFSGLSVARGTLPAVSALNGKVDAAFGGVTTTGSPDLDSGWRIQGALSAPLSYSVGAQVDGVVASIQSQTFTHVAGHLFWRNPMQGLIGAYGSSSTWNTATRHRAAFEGEAYFGNLSLETLTGFEMGSTGTGFFSITDVALYANPNFRLSAGFRTNGLASAFAGGLEYQFASGSQGGWAGFVDAEMGTSNNYQKAFAGLRLYLGADKSLVRRHREDDPRIKADEQALTTGCGGAVASDGLTLVDSETVLCEIEIPK
jgi:hypothetical protein